MTQDLARRIIDEIDRGTDDGRPYSNHPNARSRAAATVVARHLPGKTESQAREIIKTWVRNDALREVADLYDPKDRKKVEGLKANPGNQPGTVWQ